LFAMITGVVKFQDKGQMGKFISILPLEDAVATTDKESKPAPVAAD